MGSNWCGTILPKKCTYLLKLCNAKKGKKKHMQSLLEVFCVSHMPTLGVVNIKKWKLNNVNESNPNWKGITITFLPM